MDPEGAQGPPGEVTAVDLANGLLPPLNQTCTNTNANTNAVATQDSPFADPDMEALRQKLNELIRNGRRV